MSDLAPDDRNSFLVRAAPGTKVLLSLYADQLAGISPKARFRVCRDAGDTSGNPYENHQRMVIRFPRNLSSPDDIDLYTRNGHFVANLGGLIEHGSDPRMYDLLKEASRLLGHSDPDEFVYFRSIIKQIEQDSPAWDGESVLLFVSAYVGIRSPSEEMQTNENDLEQEVDSIHVYAGKHPSLIGPSDGYIGTRTEHLLAFWRRDFPDENELV